MKTVNQGLNFPEQVLLETPVEKDFMLFFYKTQTLLVSDYRLIIRDKTSKRWTNSFIDTELKRYIPYAQLKGITKSTISNASAFVLHVRMEYDELFYSYELQGIIELIKRTYARLTKKNLPIFGVPSKDLR
jgi:hypothetical protein